MAETSKGTIEELLKEFVALVSREIRLDAAYWFGSTVHNDAGENSDIDIALVSPDFTGVRFDDAKRLFPFVIRVDSRIEVHPYPRTRFHEGTPLVAEILRTGKKVA